MELCDDDLSPLKRYKSDPSLFKMQSRSVSKSGSPQSDHSENQLLGNKHVRRHLVARRLSTSNLSPRTIFRIPSRLDQIKFEESVDKCIVEAAHEKETQSAINMSRSWEHLCLSDSEPMAVDGQKTPSICDQVPLFVPNASPARACISPLAMFSSGSSPSYSATCASPVMTKHVPMNVAKRKLNVNDSFHTPAKRALLSPGVFQSISLGNSKLNSDEQTMSYESMPRSSSFLSSQNSLSSSPFTCYSDGSSSPSLETSQSPFGGSLSLPTSSGEWEQTPCVYVVAPSGRQYYYSSGTST